ncbi:Centromere/kinetochore protein zw10 [Haplosporangium sp. Z 11]|nr:Centromere/kinetochore protein zw10 [Haplosporangium sp. Z 11]
MATATFSGHNFARIVISHLLEPQAGSPSTSLIANGSNDVTEPATMDELMLAVTSLDSEIQSTKAQVYKKLLANYSAFSESFVYSLELKDKINGLLERADDMTSQTMDPEAWRCTGLRQTVMSALVDHHEISYKVQENNAILEGLSHFSRVEDILSQYESCMDAGKILQAGHCIQQAEQCTRMTEAIDQMLDELVSNSIHTTHSNQDSTCSFNLTLTYDIKVPPLSMPRSGSGSTPSTIRWHELIRALTLLDVAREKLRPLQKALIRHLLQPLIQYHHDAVLQIDSSADYATSHESSISLSTRPGQGTGGADDLFENIRRVFEYIHRNIFLQGYVSVDFNADEFSSDTEILTHFIGRNIAKEACTMISKYYLSAIVPSDVQGLKKFESIASTATQFEEGLVSMGFLTDADRELRDFVENIEIHYTNNKRDTLLKIGRAVIMNEDFKTVQVKDLDKDAADDDSWGHISDLDTELKDSSVSIKSKQLVDMVFSTLKEAGSLSEVGSPHLYQATRSLIDLFRALMPVHHARTLTNVPALTMLFYNDCMYIARELEKVPARMEDGIPGMEDVQYDDVIPALKALAKKWLGVQVRKQQDELMESIDEADGFQDSSQENNYAACERSMKQVVLVFKHLGKAWKPTLSPITFYSVLGQLLDGAVRRVIKELEELTDISEKESHKLARLCSVLFECEDQFDSAGPFVERVKGDAYNDEDPIHYFVPSWEKFQQLTDVLELSFAEIMTRFRAGQLHMFEEQELSNLVCALFADTPLRQHNLQEIEQGHPMPLPRG